MTTARFKSLLRGPGAVLALLLGLSGQVLAQTTGSAGYPPGVTPLGGTGTATTGAATATLTPAAGTFAYVCGANVLASATAAISTSNATIGTLIGSGTVSFLQQVGATATPFATSYAPPSPQCIRANAVSTAITLTTVAAGTGGSTTAYIWGYQQ